MIFIVLFLVVNRFLQVWAARGERWWLFVHRQTCGSLGGWRWALFLFATGLQLYEYTYQVNWLAFRRDTDICSYFKIFVKYI